MIRATFLADNGYPFDLTGHTVYFALTDYVNLCSSPAIRKEAALVESDSRNVAAVKLTPEDTRDLAGKFKYRFTVLDGHGGADAIEGDLIITVCTDKEAITK